MIDSQKITNRFLKYVSFDTRSSEENDRELPSTPGQMVLARFLAEELKSLGLTDVSLDDQGYVMGTLPATAGITGSTVGFIAHMDTSPEASGKDVKPLLVRNYDGKDILLNRDKQILFSTEDFPEVKKYRGQDHRRHHPFGGGRQSRGGGHCDGSGIFPGPSGNSPRDSPGGLYP